MPSLTRMLSFSSHIARFSLMIFLYMSENCPRGPSVMDDVSPYSEFLRANSSAHCGNCSRKIALSSCPSFSSIVKVTSIGPSGPSP